MDFHPSDLAFSLINIIVLAFLLRLILWKPVNRFLSERAARVRSELESAEKTRLEAEARLLEYGQQLEGVETRRQEVLRAGQIQASAEAEEILKDAREKSSQLILQARERISEEREREVSGARREMAEMAAEIASSILKREVSPEDSINAAEEFFSH